jgi:hypothetical protein
MGSHIPLRLAKDEFKKTIIETVKHYGLEDPEGRAEAVVRRVYEGFEGPEPRARLIINPEIFASLTADESALCAPLLEELSQKVFRASDQIFEKVLDARMMAEVTKIAGEWLQGAEPPDDSRKN